MKLFDEMEKCFPEIEKHWDELFQEIPEDAFILPGMVKDICFILEVWMMDEYLGEEGELRALFEQAGFREPKQMARVMLEWMHYVRCSEGRPYIIQKGIFSARE